MVFSPELSPEAYRTAEQLRSEWVVQVSGIVRRRPPESENQTLPTGLVEVFADEVTVLNSSLTPPFYIEDDVKADEALRLRYRYLDLRRPQMQRNLILRHQVVKYIRDFLDARGFLEVETPILIKSTPEGARDYLVPSRMQKGSFYALPQSPQQLKQLLMVSGVERYFQIARCFRDEDLRADRQPEFTQLDLEMSFVEQEDVLQLTEELYTGMVEKLTPHKKLIKPFPRLPYDDVMARYGSEKPDLRFGLEMTDVTDLAGETEFRVFLSTIEQGGIVKGFVAPGQGHYTGSDMRRLEETAKEFGAAGMSHVRLQGDGSPADLDEENFLLSPGLRMPVEWSRRVAARMGAGGDDLIVLMAGPAAVNCGSLPARSTSGSAWGWWTRTPFPSPSLPDSRSLSGTRTTTAGTLPTIPSHRRRTVKRPCWRGMIWAVLSPRPTTWSATGRNWLAEASASTAAIFRRKFSPSWATARNRSKSGSATSWRHLSMARRPTGESPRASTGWSPSWPAPTPYGT